MTLPALALAILALLLTPGPTNTLLALAGAERGWRAALRLIPAEVAGYLLTTLPLALIGPGVLRVAPALGPALTGLAALWVGWLAFSLWRRPTPEPGAPPSVSARQVFVTTMLNPKALVFGLILLPAATSLWQAYVVFVTAILLVAGLWAGLGRSLGRHGRSPVMVPILRRTAAALMAILSVTLAARAVAG
jgi:threonine/homoserine/homoserine lactone efflux protein